MADPMEQCIVGILFPFIGMLKDENKVKAAFNKYDKDLNGFIDKEEMKKFAEGLLNATGNNAQGSNMKNTIEVVDEFIEKYDKNKDGKISLEEFKGLMIMSMSKLIQNSAASNGIPIADVIKSIEKQKDVMPQGSEELNITSNLLDHLKSI